MGGVVDVLGIPEPQHLLFCPLQLLEMSFNCLEDVEHHSSQPFALSCESQVFPLAFPVPTRPRPAHRYPRVNPSLLLPSHGDVASRQWSERGPRSSREACCPESPRGARKAGWGHVWSFIHGSPTPLQAYNGHCEALKTLAETLVNLDVRDHKGRTALFLATERAPLSVEVLTAHGRLCPHQERKRKWTPCMLLVRVPFGLLPPLTPGPFQNPEGTGVEIGRARRMETSNPDSPQDFSLPGVLP